MHLFEAFQLRSGLELPNRIVMAPMTRCMAGARGTPTPAMAAYYACRAEAGLIVSEATVISQEALGYPGVPGLYLEEQIEGWAIVTAAVHQAGGRIFAQLWHTGRAAHSYFSDVQPIAPSERALSGTVPRMRRLHYETPRAMESDDFVRVAADFVAAARRARAAGFDGVELHGANGYLIDQFLHHDSNHREDDWGGSPERMARFPLAVVDALLDALGDFPLGVRVAPAPHSYMGADVRDKAVFDHYLAELSARPLAYVHLGLYDDQRVDPVLGERPSQYLRSRYRGTLVGAGSYTPELAENALAQAAFDLCAFGRPFVANPDLVARARAGAALEPYQVELLNRLV